MNLTFNKSSELQRFEHGNMIKMLKKIHVWFLAWTALYAKSSFTSTYRLTSMVTLLQLSICIWFFPQNHYGGTMSGGHCK